MTDQHSLERPDLTGEHSGDARVREPSTPPDGGDVASDTFPAPAHPSNPFTAQLNERWQVVDDPLQWILQKKSGNPRKKNPGWRNRSFCRTRAGLLRCVREYCGVVDADALAALEALPDFHPGREETK